MSSSERVEAMELLWESFAKDGIDYPSPDWHAKILADRPEIIDSGKATCLSVDELQARLMSRCKQMESGRLSPYWICGAHRNGFGTSSRHGRNVEMRELTPENGRIMDSRIIFEE